MTLTLPRPAHAAARTLLLAACAATASAQPAPPPVTLSLAEAVSEALAHNLDIRGAERSALAARTRIGGAKGAFDPLFTLFYQHADDVSPQASTLDATVSNTVRDTFSTGFGQALWNGARYEVELSGRRFESNNPFVSLSPSYSTDLAFRFTQPLLKGLGRNANKRATLQAVNAAAIAEAELTGRARTVVKDTIDAYWELVFALANLEVQRASLGLAESLLRKNRIMVEVGTLAPLEISQAEAAVALRRQDIIAAEAAVGNAEDALRGLLGVTDDAARWHAAIVPADEPDFVAMHVDLGEALATALESRPETRTAKLRVDSAEIEAAWAKNQVKPQLDLGLSLSTAGLGGDARDFIDTDGDTVPDTFVRVSDQDFGAPFEQVADRRFNSWSASLDYRQPIFNRPAKAEYQAARLSLEQRRMDLDAARQAVTLEVRRAVRDVDSGREGVKAARATRELQEKKLDAEIKKFENGLSTNFEVLQFQTDLSEAESGELRALVEHEKSVAGFHAARGSLLAEHGLAPPALPPVTGRAVASGGP